MKRIGIPIHRDVPQLSPRAADTLPHRLAGFRWLPVYPVENLTRFRIIPEKLRCPFKG
jgi:hypothetical protein